MSELIGAKIKFIGETAFKQVDGVDEIVIVGDILEIEFKYDMVEEWKKGDNDENP